MGPRGPIRLIAEVYLSRERLIAPVAFVIIMTLVAVWFSPCRHFGGCFRNMSTVHTMHDGWMSALSLELRRAVSCVIYNICMFLLMYNFFFFFSRSSATLAIFFFSLSFSLPKCIYIKKWDKGT